MFLGASIPPKTLEQLPPYLHHPPSFSLSLPSALSEGPGVYPLKNFLKPRWLHVKFDAFLGKI